MTVTQPLTTRPPSNDEHLKRMQSVHAQVDHRQLHARRIPPPRAQSLRAVRDRTRGRGSAGLLVICRRLHRQRASWQYFMLSSHQLGHCRRIRRCIRPHWCAPYIGPVQGLGLNLSPPRTLSAGHYVLQCQCMGMWVLGRRVGGVIIIVRRSAL